MANATVISKPQPNLLADFSLVLVALIWGINMSVMKYAIGEMDPYLFNAVRLTLSALVLGFCAWLQQRTQQPDGAVPNPNSNVGPKLSRLQIASIVIGFSILTGAVYQIIFVMGMDRTTAGNAAIIMSSVPMWTALVSVFLVGERLGRIAWFGLTITFVGTAVVTLQKNGIDVSSNHLTGNLMVLVSALAWSIAAVISRPILKFVSPIKLAFFATACTLPVHFIAAREFLSFDVLTSIDSQVVICIVYSGIFSTGLAYAMWNFGVQQLGASHASVFQNLVPLVALVCSWYFLHEIVTPVQLAGGAMIIAGLVVVRKNRKRSC